MPRLRRFWDSLVGGVDPEVEQVLEDAPREAAPLTDDQAHGHSLLGLLFLAVAAPLAGLGADGEHVDLLVLAVLVAGMVVAGRVEFPVGSGYAVPTQLFFVPMLFLIPPALVPIVVAGAGLVERLPDYLTRRRHPERALLHLADSWFAVGPALVFLAFGVEGVSWGDWPVWLLALLAQVVFDLNASLARGALAYGVRVRLQLGFLPLVWVVDVVLSCIGLLGAVAAEEQRLGFLLVLPLLGLLALFAAERSSRMEQALELSRTYRGTALLLGEVLGEDDEYTGVHSQGVVALSSDIAREMGLGPRQRQVVEFGALLHDVGKIAIPKDVLNKTGPLDDDEWEIMRTHTVEGQRMLDRVGGSLTEVGVVVRASHERWDGGGYPDGLVGEEIPLAARIVSCADTFSAITTDRPYRPARSYETAIAELRAHAGTQFDPEVVEATVRVLERARRPSLVVPTSSSTPASA